MQSQENHLVTNMKLNKNLTKLKEKEIQPPRRNYLGSIRLQLLKEGIQKSKAEQCRDNHNQDNTVIVGNIIILGKPVLLNKELQEQKKKLENSKTKQKLKV